jgi:hypothetical protein
MIQKFASDSEKDKVSTPNWIISSQNNPTFFPVN